jgi:hypothetical protein
MENIFGEDTEGEVIAGRLEMRAGTAAPQKWAPVSLRVQGRRKIKTIDRGMLPTRRSVDARAQ